MCESEIMDVYAFLSEPIQKKRKGALSDCSGADLDRGLLGLPDNKQYFEEDCDTEDSELTNPFICCALNIIQFNIIISDDIQHKEVVRPFKPTMAHQIFGHEEVVNGYRNLQVRFQILANSFNTRIVLTYDEVMDNRLRGEFADNIQDKLQEWFPHKIEDEKAFDDLKAKEDFSVMYGINLVQFKLEDDYGEHMVHINLCDGADAAFLDFHKRFQALIVFYIDAASIIDVQDKNWTYFYVYRDVNVDGKLGYMPIGFCTVYNFAMSSRSRIAQLFILPNFHSKGIGTKLLGTVYQYYQSKTEVQHITVESPCEEFTIMRDKLDIRLLLNDPAFERTRIMRGVFTRRMEKTARLICKMCSTQAKHIYCILYSFYSKDDPVKYEKFVHYMKKEIHGTYKRKLNRINSNPNKVDKVLKIKRIVSDDWLLNRRIEKDVKVFIKSVRPQVVYISKLLEK